MTIASTQKTLRGERILFEESSMKEVFEWILVIRVFMFAVQLGRVEILQKWEEDSFDS